MRKWFIRLCFLAVVGFALFWWLTVPQTLAKGALDGLTPDAAKGEQVFYAAGCASCHSAPEAQGEDKLVLSGGQRFPSDFGTFIAPNISPDTQHGIGTMSASAFANAMLYGTSPEGKHYYPAFPYASYQRALSQPDGLQDIVNLHAFLQTLPAADVPSQAHEVGFPFTLRRGLGLWKLLFVDEAFVSTAGIDSQELQRGRYLVEALGHCGECHTPRNALGGLQYDAWLAGAPDPSGKGRVPAINTLEWSAGDISYYLESGFTPEFDSAGGHMVNVIGNTSKLPKSDREAIATYLKDLSLP